MDSIRICLCGFTAGMLATFCMDFTAKKLIRHQVIHLQGLQFGPSVLGRWFVELLRSRSIFLTDIRSVLPIEHEARIGQFLHYGIGGFLGLVFFLAFEARMIDLGVSILVIGLVFGLATNAFPWLFMFPSMGFGFFAKNLPMQNQILLLSGLNHIVYGLVLGVCAFLVHCI